ncbi:hypothetical protein EDB89DRAFT_1903283 [Lactarius sanguifluus]|nr:hypothetical protein EDB89DRAFT_1903283 [Lactarius sanguifluus]
MSHCWDFWCRFSDAMLSYGSHSRARAWQMRGTRAPPAYIPTMGCETAGKRTLASDRARLQTMVPQRGRTHMWAPQFLPPTTRLSCEASPLTRTLDRQLVEAFICSLAECRQLRLIHYRQPAPAPYMDEKGADYPPHLAQAPRYVPQQNSPHCSSSLGFGAGYVNSRGREALLRLFAFRKGGEEDQCLGRGGALPYPADSDRRPLCFEPTPSIRSNRDTQSRDESSNRCSTVDPSMARFADAERLLPGTRWYFMFVIPGFVSAIADRASGSFSGPPEIPQSHSSSVASIRFQNLGTPEAQITFAWCDLGSVLCAFQMFQGDERRKPLKRTVHMKTLACHFLLQKRFSQTLAIKSVSTSYDAFVDLFDSIEYSLRRLELLSTLAFVTQHVKRGRLSLSFSSLMHRLNVTREFWKLLGENETDAVLQRLDRMNHEEARTTARTDAGGCIVYRLVEEYESGYGCVALRDMLVLPRNGSTYIIPDALDEHPKSAGTPSPRESFLKLVGWLS